MILCNPNNPTGYVTEKKDVVKLLDNISESIIIVDEAYADFSNNSVVDLIDEYENLIVMRTLSKAFGLAGLRVGAMIANEELIKYLWKVKVPYNLNMLSQYAALKALDNTALVNSYIKEVIKLREELKIELKNLDFIVYDSGSNFLFVKSSVDNLYEKLINCGILIRKIIFRKETYYRITIGTKKENEILLDEIKKLKEA